MTGLAGRAVLLAALSAGAALSAAPAAACRLALLLALDVSSSVDLAEDALQRSGLAAALTSPEVRAAILADTDRPVALSVYEWSGRQQQTITLDWTLLDSEAAIDRAASAIAGSRREFTEFPTALGYAVGFAASRFSSGPDCLARTLDVSGDGPNNEGFVPNLAFLHFPLDGVTVNALAIGDDDPGLEAYYLENLVRGPGAFVETARDYADFEAAMQRKLLREIAPPVFGGTGRPAPGSRS